MKKNIDNLLRSPCILVYSGLFIVLLTSFPQDNAYGLFGKMSVRERAVREKLSKNKEDVMALTRLGEIYWKEGKRRVAMTCFKKAVKANSEYPPPYFFLGKGYFFMDDKTRGIEQFDLFEEKMDKIIKENASYRDFYLSSLKYISYMYTTDKRYDEVLRIYKKVIELDPDDQKAHYNLAVCYYRFYQNLPMAYKELNIVIDLDTDSFLADKAEFFIDYMRNNPDSRYISDFTFIEEKD